MTGVAVDDVYRPQEDSRLLIESLSRIGSLDRRRVVDLGTGSGVVALAAAALGARSVTAYDICPKAVRSTQVNALASGVEIQARLGSWTQAMECEPFDVVLSNPPYVPTGRGIAIGSVPSSAGPVTSWNGGADGRSILDPLCASVPRMLTKGGVFLLVQSEFAGIGKSVAMLSQAGLDARVIASQRVPFGPVLSAHALELEAAGLLPQGHRDELLAVIRADKR